MSSGSNCSYTLSNDRTVPGVSPVHDQLKTPEQVTCTFGIRYNACTVAYCDFNFQMSFDSVYRIDNNISHISLHLLSFLSKGIEFPDFVRECWLCAADTIGPAAYTPVHTVFLGNICVPPSPGTVSLGLSAFAAKDSEASNVCMVVDAEFVPAERHAVANRITAVPVGLSKRGAVVRAAVLVVARSGVVVSPRARPCVTLILPVAIVHRAIVAGERRKGSSQCSLLVLGRKT